MLGAVPLKTPFVGTVKIVNVIASPSGSLPVRVIAAPESSLVLIL